jgi:hypothetical protein
MMHTLRHTAALVALAAIATSAGAQRSAQGPVTPERTVRYAARGSASSSEIELVRGGELIGRITTEWSRVAGTSPARRRVLTLYREGVKARTIELPLEGSAPDPASRAFAPSALFRTVAAPVVGASWSGFSCDGQMNALFDAIDSYWAADGAASACGGCFSATMSLYAAGAGVAYASARLDVCTAVS